MAVTDTNAIRYCNTRIRPLADFLAKAYILSLEVIQEGGAMGVINVATPASAVIPNDATPITDGAVTDGRPQIQGADVYNVVALAQVFLNAMTATSNQKLNQILRVAVNTNP